MADRSGSDQGPSKGQIAAIIGFFFVGLVVTGAFLVDRNQPDVVGVGTTTTAAPAISTTSPEAQSTSSSSTTTTIPVRLPGTVPGFTVAQPWGTTLGLTMFRGNPTRSYFGSGDLSGEPAVDWRYPDSAMCSTSSVANETSLWCGTGWTGQPVVWERADGITEVIFGAYDRAVHFVDAETGVDLRPPFPTGDIIKGSVTLDPDGFPLLYFGSRDNQLRIVALDRDVPTLLWSMDANEVDGVWNNDWDSNPVIVDDVMYEGGENGWFFAIGLNRSYGSDGLVTVLPEKLVQMAGYDEDLLAKSGRNVSIESSVVAFDDRVYFANSGGRIVGVDVSQVWEGIAPIVFDFYAGGDIDATPTIDADGMLYASIEHEPSEMNSVEKARNLEVGQLIKLDPYAEGDPLLWGVDLTEPGVDSGSWASPAVYKGFVYTNTHAGSLIAVDGETGVVVWSDDVGFHSWSSPAIVDGVLVTATCLGDVRAYSLANPANPLKLWSVNLGGACLESTPAIWNGRIYIGSRDGFMRALG